MAKRGISMMAEQQRLRTVRGGLESLSVWDDSDTDRRFRRLQGQRRGTFRKLEKGSLVKHSAQNSHLRRSHQPRAISGFESAQAVDAVSSFLTEAALGGRRSPLLFVQGQTLHAAVHLHNDNALWCQLTP